MLKGIDPLLHADLLHALRAMGHGDEIAVVDANFPAAAMAQRLIRLDGVSATRALEAILSLQPLDDFVERPAHRMQVVGNAKAVPAVCRGFQALVDRAAGCWARSKDRNSTSESAAVMRWLPQARRGFTAISS